jgi:hypothetical protein
VSGNEPSHIEKELNMLGKEGWELVWVVEHKTQQMNTVARQQSYTFDAFTFLTLFFKKAIEN